MEKKVKMAVLLGYITAGIIVLLLIAVGIYGIIWKVNDNKLKENEIKAEKVDLSEYVTAEDTELYPYYKATANIYETANDIYLVFDPSTGKFEYKTGNTILTGGDYRVEKNEVITEYEVDSSTSNVQVKYMMEGEYIFFESNVCDGEKITGTGLFNATFSRVDANLYGYRYTFKDDGTYTLEYGNDYTNYTVFNGTYERDSENPQIIKRTLNDKEALPFYIFHGHLVDSVYKQISEEEYEADMLYYESLEESEL